MSGLKKLNEHTKLNELYEFNEINELIKLKARFKDVFGTLDGQERVFFAPGRVNLIGEYTDVTGGYVFPASLTYGTWAVARLRSDGKFRLASTAFEPLVEVDKQDIRYRREDGWANYPKGVIRELDKLGVALTGCDMLFHGNIPYGAGLSSSASLELAASVALASLSGAGLSMMELAKLAQRAENGFVGVNCGIMDQFAAAMGRADMAVLLKCDSLAYRYVPLSLEDIRLIITHSHKRHSLTESKYNERRRECEEGFGIIKQHLPELSCLGDVTLEQWQGVHQFVKPQNIFKRLEHVVNENARALASTAALERGDWGAFGQYMIESHKSLRDLYEVTGVELDTLFTEAAKVPGCIGTRMTGAGFGGCTVSLVHKDAVEEFQDCVRQGYYARTGLIPSFYSCDIGDGAHEVTWEKGGINS